jgi:polyhydroxybutyrate depolymerase
VHRSVSTGIVIRVLLVYLGLLAAWAPSPAQAKGDLTNFNTFTLPGVHSGIVPVDNRNRSFIIVTPERANFDHPAPIVFFFHGAGGTAEQAMQTYNWVAKAKKEHFFIVFPQGLGARPDKPSDFFTNPAIWRSSADSVAANEVNDVDFFSLLLTKLKEVLPIDPRRIYVTGFSNGGEMTFLLGNRFSDQIAAIAAVSAPIRLTLAPLARPLPLYFLVGAEDPIVPPAGGPTTLPWGATVTWAPAQSMVDKWAALNGCDPKPEVVSDRDGVKVVRYKARKGHADVIYTVVAGNGHHWPTSVELLPASVAGPARDPISATDQIWDFFQHHPLPK